jgi:Arc/MetJ-type ribon-helix-helix transcriptional regulator
MGLKDLKKPASAAPIAVDQEDAASAFISGAAVKSATQSSGRRRGRPPKKISELRNTTPTTFSLDKKVNKDIDRLTLLPDNLKVSRSDVVRAGVLALQEMDKADAIALLERVTKSESLNEDI